MIGFQDRRKVYAILEGEGIEIPRYAVLDRDSPDPKRKCRRIGLTQSPTLISATSEHAFFYPHLQLFLQISYLDNSVGNYV